MCIYDGLELDRSALGLLSKYGEYPDGQSDLSYSKSSNTASSILWRISRIN